MTFPRYFRRLQALLLRRGCRRVDADDLIQAAYLKMEEYCRKGGEVHKPESFLVRTVLRLASNARRDEHRELYSDQSVEELTFILDPQPAPDEVFVADQCLELMSEALGRANQRTRDIFFMHRLDGMTHAEIARRMGISVSAVEKHIAIALVILSEVNELQ